MYKISALAVIVVSAFLGACKSDPKTAETTADVQHASPKIMEGHWVALDFCSRANQYGSVLGAMNNAHAPYAFAFSFKEAQPDSVTCYNGFKMWTHAVKFDGDTIEIKDANQGKSIFLMYTPSNKEITMFDATNERGAQIDRFVKSKANVTNGYAAFATALNHNLFEGFFYPIGQKTENPVRFTVDGNVEQLPGYDRYQVCAGGDCFLLGDVMDIITLADKKTKSTKRFGFKYSAQNDTLSLYQLVESGNEKSAQLGKVAYRFLRKLPEQKISK